MAHSADFDCHDWVFYSTLSTCLLINIRTQSCPAGNSARSVGTVANRSGGFGETRSGENLGNTTIVRRAAKSPQQAKLNGPIEPLF